MCKFYAPNKYSIFPDKLRHNALIQRKLLLINKKPETSRRIHLIN